MDKLAVLILAAGKGKRMKSHLPKVLHTLAGKPLLAYVVDLARGLNPERIIIIVGHMAEKVSRLFPHDTVYFVKQEEQLGTGHAVQQTEEILKDFHGNILILSGDVPLLKIETVHKLIKIHRDSGAAITLLTVKTPNPDGYGRIMRDEKGRVVNIVEDKDATPEIKKIAEINSGIYCFKKDLLFNLLKGIKRDNVQQEYYLTDVIYLAFNSSLKIEAVVAEDPYEIMGINTQEELKEAEEIYVRHSQLHRGTEFSPHTH
jgi:UDP-N-acetylglucosamine diphosphorylase/glucosamine-1-phosphate N-acetyltransferase